MTETNNNVVATRGLTKIFRDFWLREKVSAVTDLDLDILPREVFGLLGPNGSGKSTTLKIVLGLMFPTRGQVSVFGKPPTDVGAKARIGFLPEESYLYPFLDARETLDFYGRLFHQPRAERRRRIDMLLEMVGLGKAAYRRVGEYSKGMQRRIGLAQALINDPDLLILDEPTSGMDPLGTRQFKDIIRTLAARGKTVILSSHLLADVEDVCDRVCVLYGGQRRALGSIDELLARSSQTQLTTDSLDEPTLARIKQILAEAGKSLHEVTAPRDRLENLFLRIVAEAREQRVTTGGAVGSGEVAEFLRGEGPEGKAVIERLVSTDRADQPADETPEPETPEPPEAEPEVLEELMEPQATEPEPTAEPEEPGRAGGVPQERGEEAPERTKPQAPRRDAEADRGVIDSLIEPDEQERE